MKKMMLSGLSIIGIINLANAWERSPPQSWSVGDFGSRVTCYNTQVGFCMSGEGTNPSKGQSCLIWTKEGKYISSGRVVSFSLMLGEVEAETSTDSNSIPN